MNVVHYWLGHIMSTACTADRPSLDKLTQDPMEVTCSDCINGLAGLVEAKLLSCKACGGSGKASGSGPTAAFSGAMELTCLACAGTGRRQA